VLPCDILSLEHHSCTKPDWNFASSLDAEFPANGLEIFLDLGGQIFSSERPSVNTCSVCFYNTQDVETFMRFIVRPWKYHPDPVDKRRVSNIPLKGSTKHMRVAVDVLGKVESKHVA
jgi:hypothetical protein